MIRQLKSKIINQILNKKYKLSYSQCGEDLIIDYMFQIFKFKNPTYLDIGANDPIILNNTYLFYKKGFSGVCVEPDPFLYNNLSKIRKRDTCLNVGIKDSEETDDLLDFYILTSKTLNTFSKTRANEILKYKYYGNQEIKKTVKISMLSINDVIDQYFDISPTFISIDVEGSELNILKTLNLDKYRPKVFCVETIEYNNDLSLKKNYDLIDFMDRYDYMVYADTLINSIFVDKLTWKEKYGGKLLANM